MAEDAAKTRLLTAREVGALLGVRHKFVYVLAERGDLPGAVRIGPHRLRFDARAVASFIERGGTRPQSVREVER